jgi:ABC-type sulfate transport system permease component
MILPAALLFLYLVGPLVALPENLSGKNLLATYGDPQTRGAIVTSLVTATVSTAIVAALGVPLAYLLATVHFRGRTLANILVFLPLVLPPVSAGILLLMLYGPYGTVGHLLAPSGMTLVDTAAGIVLAQTFVSAPFVIVAARSAFERVEGELFEAASSMGAGAWQIFWHVGLPLARSGIAAGLTLGWLRALGEFGATVILAYHPYSLPVLNYVDLSSTGLVQALPLALLTLLIAAAVLLMLVFVGRLDLAAGARDARAE